MQKIIAIEYLYTQNKGFVHVNVLLNIDFALNGKLFEVFRPFNISVISTPD